MTGPIVDAKTSQEVEKLLERSGALKTGHFQLSSGLHSDRYCQCASLFEDAAAASLIAKMMRDHLPRDLRADVVLAPAMGAVLWGYELSRALGCRSIFAERVDGQFALRRGFALSPGERVIIAEDVVTTGKSALELMPLLEAAGAEVVAFASVVDRSKGTFEPGPPAYALCRLAFNTWTQEECPMDKAGMPLDSPGSRRLSQGGGR